MLYQVSAYALHVNPRQMCHQNAHLYACKALSSHAKHMRLQRFVELVSMRHQPSMLERVRLEHDVNDHRRHAEDPRTASCNPSSARPRSAKSTFDVEVDRADRPLPSISGNPRRAEGMVLKCVHRPALCALHHCIGLVRTSAAHTAHAYNARIQRTYQRAMLRPDPI